MKRHIAFSLLCGTIFGAGLAIGGMTNPLRVRGFLDLFGVWDPTLAFVMGGAVIVMALAWRLMPAMSKPLLAESFAFPTRSDISPRLVAGAGLFGIGWGMAGLCPGPAIAAFAIEPKAAALFVVSMVAGMGAARLVLARTGT